MPIQPLEPIDPEAVGPYRLLARLGAGGMGRVYLARSAGGRTVAVKVVRAELAEDPEFRERFRREVSAAQAVSGAYTAPVVDADRDGPTPWLATTYVLGPSLTEAVTEHGPLPADTVRALGSGLAEALAAIHAAGLVHRDLKPSNVLLATDGPRVIDFGIARAMDGSKLTSTGIVVGSPGFMCPEQANGAPMGPPGDVFSLGSVLAYAATGKGPFNHDTESAAALLYRVIHHDPVLTGLPDGLRPAITACLAKDPADRPTPAELGALLGARESLARAAWLPAPVSSDIAAHAAEVMDMETPARGNAVVPTPTQVSVPVPTEGTMRLGAKAPAAAPALAEAPAEPAKPAPSRRLLLAGGGAALVAALGGAAAWALSGSPKPTPHPTPVPTHPSGSPSPLPTTSRAPGVPPVALWTYKLTNDNPTQAAPLCANGVLYIGGDGLYALDVATGKERFTQPEAAASNLATAGGSVSFGSVIDITTIDGATGAILWKFTSKNTADGKTSIASDTVLAADDKAVYAMCSFIALDQNGLPNMDAPNAPGIFALSRKDGSVLWSQRRNAKADFTVNTVLAKNTILYTDSQKNLVARSITDGSQLWFAETDARGSYYQPVTDGDRVFCSATGAGIQAVNIDGGKQAWAKTSPDSHLWYSPPAVGDGVVYSVLGGQTVSMNGTTYTPPTGPVLYAYKATDGTELWRLPLPNECAMAVSPIVVQQTVFVATPDKGIYAIDTTGHKVRWAFQNGLTDTLDWKFGTDGARLIAAQGDRVYALPPV
ncbi:serine/threonine-protein kinase [Kitasatospora sp. MAP5-34]|uniref:serine/threonine-protein kinase n=1 Tax=Kitasatospora sp. MAP5-34 TaxID=3035102 RepID=UPI002472ED74|nr:serine/threonine-protein kinase [Kitasatospora sp. MAP5-34]MDH6578004.1 outer membrane protein assembly factor BamB [Kitasatospora sp. MAP5-34]